MPDTRPGMASQPKCPISFGRLLSQALRMRRQSRCNEAGLGARRRLRGRVLVDVAALEQIVEAADAIPAIAIGFHQERMPAAAVGAAVILVEQVDQQLSGVAGQSDSKRDLARLLTEI